MWIFGGILIGGSYRNPGCKKSEDDSHAGNGEYVQWNGRRMCGIDIYCGV